MSVTSADSSIFATGRPVRIPTPPLQPLPDYYTNFWLGTLAEQHHPGHAVAELRADLGVGRDAAWIVVRGAGDQAWAKNSQEPAFLECLGATGDVRTAPRGEVEPYYPTGDLGGTGH